MMNEFANHVSVRDEAVCIVGMHRSGTSLITQLLHQSGLYLGSEDSLLGSNVGNQHGHFEHLGFIELNDAILKQLGGTWEFPPELKSGWENSTSLDPLRSRARDLLHSFSGKSPWGWKDPRTTLLLPFWRSLIPDLRFVISVRSPLAVAKSLHDRNKMPLTRGAYLWDRYTRASLADTESGRRQVVFYDRFFKYPEQEVSTLLKFCGLPATDPAVVAATIRPELRHHQSDMAALLACDEIAIETKLLYLALRGIGLSGDDLAGRDSGADKTISELLRLLERMPQHQLLGELQSRLNRSESELANLRAEVWRDAKANHQWAYRFYRKILRPFQLARFRSSQ
ncbi:MAG TPA: sulfotransferase [Candidatus Binatia bacterium]|nr:sulfotransferase [Candidatus Binatia bacterium]